MAPVLSFIHVVIGHINFHHPSYASYYRAYPPEELTKATPFIHPTELSTCQAHCIIVSFLFYLQLDQAAAPNFSTPTQITATGANCVPLFKERVYKSS